MADQEAPRPRRRRTKRTSSAAPTQEATPAKPEVWPIVDSADVKPDGADYEGVMLLVTWGKEHIQGSGPSRYHGMDIGPFAMTIPINAGETPLAAKRRAMRHMNAMAEEELLSKGPMFIKRCKSFGNSI